MPSRPTTATACSICCRPRRVRNASRRPTASFRRCDMPPDTAPEDRAWCAPLRRPQPAKTFEQKLKFHGGPLTLPRHYIYCTRHAPDDRFRRFYERAMREGWGVTEIDSSHNPHITCPEVAGGSARPDCGLDFAAVVGPVQQCLALAPPAQQIAGLAMLLDLPDMAADRFPAADLPRVLIRHAAAHVVAAIPLEPAARIVGMEPTFAPPFRQRLAGIDAEEIERRIAAAVATAWRARTSFWETRGGSLSCICRRTRRAAASRPASVAA